MKPLADDTRLARIARLNATNTTVRRQKILPMHKQEGFGLTTWVMTLVCAVAASTFGYLALWVF